MTNWNSSKILQQQTIICKRDAQALSPIYIRARLSLTLITSKSTSIFANNYYRKAIRHKEPKALSIPTVIFYTLTHFCKKIIYLLLDNSNFPNNSNAYESKQPLFAECWAQRSSKYFPLTISACYEIQVKWLSFLAVQCCSMWQDS